MNRSIVATLVAASIFCTAIVTHAECAAETSARSVVDSLLAPAPNRVPLAIRVTEARRVFVRDASATNGLRYVCTTPCRLYVQPGPIDVTLVGWGAHEYHWEVPAHGGSVSLLARPTPPSIVAARLAAERAFASRDTAAPDSSSLVGELARPSAE